MAQDKPDMIDALDTLLEQERGALLKGDLASIEPLLARKEELIDRLNAELSEPRAAISALRGKVLRNQELLDGALEGIRNIAGRMAAVRRIRKNLETYDSTGRKSAISGVIEHKVEKRA